MINSPQPFQTASLHSPLQLVQSIPPSNLQTRSKVLISWDHRANASQCQRLLLNPMLALCSHSKLIAVRSFRTKAPKTSGGSQARAPQYGQLQLPYTMETPLM